MGVWDSLKDSVSRNLAFCPPEPSTYTVIAKDTAAGQDHAEVTLTYPRLPSSAAVTLHTTRTPTLPDGGGGTKIILAWIPHKNARSAKTIIYSHPNALDLGHCIPYCIDLSKLLGVNVLTYDYTGYGCSEGLPSVRHSRADITAAYKFLENHMGMNEKDVVLMGASLGSGPSVYLASQLPRLSGLILQSPLLSGVRVLKPKLKWWPTLLDVFPNFRLIQQVEASTLIIHGTQDEVIDVDHGKRLHELAKNPYPKPLWANGYTHQNISTCPEYIPHIQRFLRDL